MLNCGFEVLVLDVSEYDNQRKYFLGVYMDDDSQIS